MRPKGGPTFVTEDGGTRVAEIGVYELSRDNFVAIERLSLGLLHTVPAGIR